MIELDEVYQQELGYPVEVVERARDARPPLIRAAELFANRSPRLSRPFELIRHRARTYALIALETKPFGWHSRIIAAPSGGHSLQQRFRVWAQFDLEVLTVSLGPDALLIIDASRSGSNATKTGLRRYMYEEPPDATTRTHR